MTVLEHRLFLLRHGETEWSKSGRHTGSTDLDLTDNGRNQAKLTAEAFADLHLDDPLVISSPRRRALDTAALAGLTVDEVTELLAEWDYGDYEGLTTPQIRERVPGWTVWTHPCPGGESAEDVTRRADVVLGRCRDALADGDVLLVGHGHFGRVLIARWIGLPATEGVRVRMDTAAVTVLGHERGVGQLVHVNVNGEAS